MFSFMIGDIMYTSFKPNLQQVQKVQLYKQLFTRFEMEESTLTVENSESRISIRSKLRIPPPVSGITTVWREQSQESL